MINSTIDAIDWCTANRQQSKFGYTVSQHTAADNRSEESYNDLIFKVLTDCINQQSEEEFKEHINELTTQDALHDYFKMLAIDDTTTASNDAYLESSILGLDGRISLAYENLRSIPAKIAENFANETKFLDLSFNYFKDLSFLQYFKTLNTLILDKNAEPDETTLPYLPSLKILWLNNCNIVNIPKWVYRIQMQCPCIQQLSLIGNPGARTLLTGATANEESDYRSFVAETLKTLTHLDGIAVPPSTSNTGSSSITTSPLIIHNAFTTGTLNQRAEMSLPSLLQHKATIQKAKSTQYQSKNTSILFRRSSNINSKIIPVSGGKLSSSTTSLKSYYLHNSQQQYQQHYSEYMQKCDKDMPLSKTNNNNNVFVHSRKKKMAKSNFKDLFMFNTERSKSCQSSTTS